AFETFAEGAKSWDPSVGAFVDHLAPVIIQPKAGVSTATWTGAEILPASGLKIPKEQCKTTGVANELPYSCPVTHGVCDTTTLLCRPAAQGVQAKTNGTCQTTA